MLASVLIFFFKGITWGYLRLSRWSQCSAGVENHHSLPAVQHLSLMSKQPNISLNDWIHVNVRITYHKWTFNTAQGSNRFFLVSWVSIIQDDHFTAPLQSSNYISSPHSGDHLISNITEKTNIIRMKLPDLHTTKSTTLPEPLTIIFVPAPS